MIRAVFDTNLLASAFIRVVTGDARLQALSSYQGVTIVSPRAFLELLG